MYNGWLTLCLSELKLTKVATPSNIHLRLLLFIWKSDACRKWQVELEDEREFIKPCFACCVFDTLAVHNCSSQFQLMTTLLQGVSGPIHSWHVQAFWRNQMRFFLCKNIFFSGHRLKFCFSLWNILWMWWNKNPNSYDPQANDDAKLKMCATINIADPTHNLCTLTTSPGGQHWRICFTSECFGVLPSDCGGQRKGTLCLVKPKEEGQRQSVCLLRMLSDCDGSQQCSCVNFFCLPSPLSCVVSEI